MNTLDLCLINGCSADRGMAGGCLVDNCVVEGCFGEDCIAAGEGFAMNPMTAPAPPPGGKETDAG